jgi:large subunit ribosomal protein L5
MDEKKQGMREIRIASVTVNMGIGQSGEELKRAQTIMEKITGVKSVQTKCKVKAPTWGLRPGLPIGCKVTLRKKKAEQFLKDSLAAKGNAISAKSFDNNGNFGFGIHEYIDMPGIKYDPKLGIRGFDVLVSLERPGFRVKRRKLLKARVSKKHAVSKNDAVDYLTKKFNTEVK